MKTRLMSSFLTVVRPGVYTVSVHAKPGARSSAFAAPVAVTDDAVEVRIAAPPVEGKANEELVDFLQTTLARAWAELRQSTPEDYLAGTSYATATAANDNNNNNNSTATTSSTALPKDGGKGKRGGARQNNNNNSSKGSKGKKNCEEDVAMPTRVSVSLARGATSRTKAVEVEFPGSAAELAGVLERASRE